MADRELAALVDQSKDALKEGQRLCQRANFLVQDSARIGVDVLAIDAKVRWLSDGVLEQLKLAAQVAKSLEDQRMRLAQEAREWDQLRSQHMHALDQVLDACGSQVVPTSFHAAPPTATDDPDDDVFRDPVEINGATSSTLKPTRQQRSIPTKTLRDFIDERAIEESADEVDDDRNRIDDLLASTARAQLQLEGQIANLEHPKHEGALVLEPLLEQQEKDAGDMAGLLMSLTTHYGQVSTAIEDHAAGHDISLDDLEVLVRDTAELPAIVAELEDFTTRIEGVHGQFVSHLTSSNAAMDLLTRTIISLTHLETQIEATLSEQSDVETEVRSVLGVLHGHLDSLDGLRATYTSYRLAYGKLVLELQRRARYGAAAEQVLENALASLEAMREDEERDRALFFAEQGSYLPDDLCLFVGNAPPRVSLAVGPREELPPLPEELVAEARRNVDLWEGRM